MPRFSRRNFIKKNIAGGLLTMAGAPFLRLGNMISPSDLWVPEANEDGPDIDWKKIRKQFPATSYKHYFNTGSFGPSPQVVIDEVCEMLQFLEGKAHVGHHYTQAVHEQVASLLQATPEEIALTRNTTEGMNIVARSVPLEAGDEVLITNHEHIGGAAPWLALQKEKGIKVRLVELDLTGENNVQRIRENLTERTRVVSFSHVTYSTGMRLPAREIVAMCREKGIFSCVDGAQALGMIPIDLQAINPDFYVASGHKWMFGPKGTGVLFMNKAVMKDCDPVFVGAYSDKTFDLNTLTLECRDTPQREEYGTRNTPIILGFGKAVDFISALGLERIEARGRMLADHFRKGIAQFPGVTIISPENPDYATSIVTIGKEGWDIPKAAKKLDQDDAVRVRVVFENGFSGMRLSFSIFNTLEEVDFLLEALGKVMDT